MRAILLSTLLFVSTPVFGSEERVREIVGYMDCTLTVLGKGVSRLRTLADSLEADSKYLLGVINDGSLTALSSPDIKSFFERGKKVIPERELIISETSKGVSDCGYSRTAQEELKTSISSVAGNDELLTEVEMFAKGISAGVGEWDRQLVRLAGTISLASARVQELTRMMKAKSREIRSGGS